MAKPKLTVKQAKIIKGKIDGKTQRDIGLELYPNATPESASVLITRELKKVNVQEALENAMIKLNITPERAMKPIDEALDHEDLEMRLKGSDRALKLMTPKGESPTFNNFGTVINELKDKYSD